MPPRPDSEYDHLMELVTHPGWRVLKQEKTKRVQSYIQGLKTQAASEFDLVRKEVTIAKMTELDEFFQVIENLADAYAKHK